MAHRIFGTFFDHSSQRLKRFFHIDVHLTRDFKKRHIVAFRYLYKVDNNVIQYVV